MEKILEDLSKSKFRSKFKLSKKDLEYIDKKGLKTIEAHAEDFIDKRIAPVDIPNDGKQTPMKNHPVFIAQHATATCCRNCVSKWHGIEKGILLNSKQKSYLVKLIMSWIKKQVN